MRRCGRWRSPPSADRAPVAPPFREPCGPDEDLEGPASEEAVEGTVIQEVLEKQQGGRAATNLGNLFKKALEQKKR